MVKNLEPEKSLEIIKVAKIADIKYDDAKFTMDHMQDAYGIDYKKFLQEKLYEKGQIERELFGSKYASTIGSRDKHIKNIMDETGWTRKQVITNVNELKNKNIGYISFNRYDSRRLYELDDEEVELLLNKVAEEEELKKSLLEDLRKVDKGQLKYSDLGEKKERFYQLIKETMIKRRREAIERKIAASLPDLTPGSDRYEEIVIDAEATNYLLSYNYYEYFMFKFYNKDIATKRTFLANGDRVKLIKFVNEDIETLFDKARTYKILAPFYKRKCVEITGQSDYDEFCKFCHKIKKFVVKPIASSLGNGVILVQIDKETDLKQRFDSLLEQYGRFLLEEQIIQSRHTAAFNPGSVNTVRMCTYYDGEKTTIISPFFRSGRAGSFVDNGGAGGLFVGVDVETGRLNSDGCNEDGAFFANHPDSGIQFNGHKLPRWKQALKLANTISSMVPGTNFIGWDLAYTKRKGWVVVEGNSMTQFVGQQAPRGIGLKKEIIETFGYKDEL